MSPPTRRPALFLDAAKADVRQLAEDDRRLAQLASADSRSGATGDRGLGDPPSHRIVYRDLGQSGGIEIVEVVAVEARGELYAYLLAAARLGRLPSESKPRFNRLHQQIVQRRAARRRE